MPASYVKRVALIGALMCALAIAATFWVPGAALADDGQDAFELGLSLGDDALATEEETSALSELAVGPLAANAISDAGNYPYKNSTNTSGADRWNFIIRQCTSFVAWRLNNDNGVAFTNSYKGQTWGNANNWDNAARRAGITVNMTPAVGAVAYYEAGAYGAGQYGHVMWVKAVNGNNVTIEEYNWDKAKKSYNQRTINKSRVSGYIHIKDISDSRKTVSVSAGTYIVMSKVGNRLLDVANGKNANYTNIQLYQPNGSSAQLFDIGWNSTLKANYLQFKGTSRFVDSEGNTASNSNVHLWDGNGAKGQNWIFEDAGDGYVYIRNLWGYYLDVVDGKDANGTNVQVHTYNGSNAQKWMLIPVSGKVQTVPQAGTYIIQSKVGNRLLDIADGSTANRANAQIYQPNGSAAQIFNIGRNDTLQASWIQLKAASSQGRFLDASGDSPHNTNVHQWDGNGKWNQNWFFEDAGDGYFYIRTMLGYYLDVVDGKDANGTNVQAHTFNGSNAQKWKILPVSGQVQKSPTLGTYTIQTKLGNRVLDVAGASKADGANIRILQPNGTIQQMFKVGWNSSLNANNIQIVNSGNWVDSASGHQKSAPANVQQKAGDGGWNQNWFFEDAGGGYYYVRNMLGYYLDVVDGKSADGTNVQVRAYNGSDAQKWKLAVPDLAYATVAAVADQAYTGKAITPKPKVTYAGTALREGSDYTLSYKNNTKAGTATITIDGKGAYRGSKSVTFKIKEVKQASVAVSKVALDKGSVSVQEGASAKLKATVSPANATNKAVAWKSSDVSVATVDANGKVTAKKAGKATITATAGGKSATCTVTVTAKRANSGGSATGDSSFDASGSTGGTSSGAAASSQANTSLPASGTWTRLAGATALDTMGAVVRAGFSKSDYVIVATNAGYWDALSASGLAGVYQCPIVLTNTKTLSKQASEQIKRLGAKNVIIVGGTSAVSANVANQIARLGCKVTRLGGRNAVDTSYKIWQYGKGRWGSDVITATKDGYWDALSIAPYAYAKKAPVLLHNNYGFEVHWHSGENHKQLSEAAAGGKRVVITGGTKAVSGEVDRRFPNSVRLAGANAYDTSLKVADWCVSQGMRADCTGVATGNGYWDALVAGPFCGAKNIPLVLVSQGNTTTIDKFIKARNIKRGYLFGGTAAISKATEAKIVGQPANPSRVTVNSQVVMLTGKVVREQWPASQHASGLPSVTYRLVLDKPIALAQDPLKRTSASKVSLDGDLVYSGQSVSSFTIAPWHQYVGKYITVKGVVCFEQGTPASQGLLVMYADAKHSGPAKVVAAWPTVQQLGS